MTKFKELENINYYPEGTIITYDKFSYDYEEEYYFKTIITTINGVKQQVNINNLQEIITNDTIVNTISKDDLITVEYPLNNNEVVDKKTIDNGDCEISFKALKDMEKVFLDKNPQLKNIDLNDQAEKYKDNSYILLRSDILNSILIEDDNYNGVFHPEKYNTLINSINTNKPVITIIDNSDKDNTIELIIETTLVDNIKIPLFSYSINLEELNSYGLEEIIHKITTISGFNIIAESKQVVIGSELLNNLLTTGDSIYISIFDTYFKEYYGNISFNYMKEEKMKSLIVLNTRNGKLPVFDKGVLNIKYPVIV